MIVSFLNMLRLGWKTIMDQARDQVTNSFKASSEVSRCFSVNCISNVCLRELELNFNMNWNYKSKYKRKVLWVQDFWSLIIKVPYQDSVK